MTAAAVAMRASARRWRVRPCISVVSLPWGLEPPCRDSDAATASAGWPQTATGLDAWPSSLRLLPHLADFSGRPAMTETVAHPEVESLLREAPQSKLAALSARERVVEALMTVVLVASVAALARFAPPRHVSWTAAGALFAAYVVAKRVTFSLGAGWTAPT